MGIDKSNLRFIIHLTISQTLSNYVQESGRGERDGNISFCILYYSFKDYDRIKKLIKNSFTDKEIIKKQINDLCKMIAYAENNEICRYKFLISIFSRNEELRLIDNFKCNNCDVCESQTLCNSINVTNVSKNVLQIIHSYAYSEKYLNSSNIEAFLRGKITVMIISQDLQNSTHFGVAINWTKFLVNRLILNLRIKYFIKEEEFILSEITKESFVLIPEGIEFLHNGNYLDMMIDKKMEKEFEPKSKKTLQFECYRDLKNACLFYALKRKHRKPFLILKQRNLKLLSQKLPIVEENYKKYYTAKNNASFYDLDLILIDVIKKYHHLIRNR